MRHKQWPLGAALVCAVLWSKSELEWVFLHRQSQQQTHTLNRKNRSCFNWCRYANVCMHKYKTHTHTIQKWLQAYRVWDHLSAHRLLTLTPTHLCHSDSVTLGIKECPHFTSVLRCSVSSTYRRDCSGITNQLGEFVVHYVTIAAAHTILIFKDMKTCGTQQVLVHCRGRAEAKAQTRSFLLN